MPPRITALLAAALVLAPVEAAAWCLLDDDPTSYAEFWRAKFPDLRIPVYVSTGYYSAFTWTGFREPQVEAIVRRVIAVHNETIGVPTLYYAGTTDQDLDPDGRPSTRPHGIVIDSFACSRVAWAPGCAANQIACTVPGGNADDLVAKARVTFEPFVCGPNAVPWTVEGLDGTDATRVLLHELGHALGLGHTSDDPCGGASDGQGGAGVMNTNLNYWPPYERGWRRDDIEGLRAIYGAEVRHAVYTWLDDAFPAAPAEAARVPLCAAVRTPPTLSSAVDGAEASPTLLLGLVDADNRVALLEWDGSQFVAPADGAVVDRSEHGLSFAPVGLAHSDGGDDPSVFLVWSADDSRTARENRLRWARRPLGGGAWELGYLNTPSGPTQTSNRVTVGHEPRTGHDLVVSTTDGAELYIIAVDRDGAQVATTIFAADGPTPVLAYDVGPPRCFVVDDTARCTISYTDGDSKAGWPYPVLTPGWIDVEVAADGSATLVATHRSELLDAHGLLDLAAGPDGQRGVVGDQRFALAAADATPVVEHERLASDDWPLRIGSHTLAGATRYHLVARRLAPCGDGVRECDEQCDDGNNLDGDGCSASCMDEPDDATTGAGATTSASTTAGDGSSGGVDEALDDDGCGCATGSRSPGALLVLVLLVMLGGRRRARAAAEHIP